MESPGLTIPQAARELGLSTRTVRRFIKSRKIKADLLPGPFGEEYRILELPAELRKPMAMHSKTGHPHAQTSIHPALQSIDIIRDLTEKNLSLAAQLGVATERIRNLENRLKLLTSARRQPWWKRLFGRKQIR
jgi:plasmid maintenance system antidote protein VapI